MRRRLLGAALAVVLTLTTVVAVGCGGKDAKVIAQAYLDALVKGDYPTAYSQFTAKLRQDITADGFAEAMKALEKDKGPVIRYDIKDVEYHGATSTVITVVLYRKKGNDAETSETKQYGFIIEGGWKLGNY
ncbi:MAG: hypothetical protein ACYC9Q_00995 [Bacillota bacterium]